MVAILKYKTQLQFDHSYKNIVPNYGKKIFSWWWRHRWRHSVTSKSVLYIPLFINGIITFFMITKQRAKISSSNFLCICIIRLWLQLYEYIFTTSLMTSPGHKIVNILKLIYLRQYLNYSVDQKLKMSEMLMAIFLVYTTSGIPSGENFCRELKMAAMWNILKYWTRLQFYLRYEKIVPNYAKKVFMVKTSSMTSQGGLKVLSIFMFRRGWLREQIARAMSRQ